MAYEWLHDYLMEKPGVVKDFKIEWDASRYLIADKMFIMVGGDKEGTPIITFKLEPTFGQFLREQYPDVVVPGYYMNKVHWNSLYLDGQVPDDIVRDMADDAYKQVLTSLPKKTREALSR